MYLNEIYKETIYGIKQSYNEADFNLSEKLDTNELLKLSVYNVGTIQPISGNLLLDSSMYSGDQSSKYPENAFTIDLKKGNYIIAYDEGGLISKSTGKVNDCIRSSSLEKLDFGEFHIDDQAVVDSATNSNYNEILQNVGYSCLKTNFFKVSSKSKLHIWVDDESIVGVLRFSIYKMNTGKYEEKLAHTFIIEKDGLFSFNLDKMFRYELRVCEIKNDEAREPHPKYPIGTYQITTYGKVGKVDNDADYDRLMNEDLRRFDINDDKLQSMMGIEIPHDVNPLNQYIMVGKVELILYIDFNNDEYYIRPASYAEVFMNLFLPGRKVKEIEVTEDYAMYEIVDFIIIDYDFRDSERIISNIKNWISCDDDDIHPDEYSLYYYISNFNLYDWYLSRFKGIINSHFMFIDISPTAQAYDNVDIVRENIDATLDFTIVQCPWYITRKQNFRYYNNIEWSYSDDWKNTDTTNQVKIDVQGHGIMKVSKKHFANVVGVDLENITGGNLTDAQFRNFKLNYPMINPYSRLQYWLGIRL